MHWLTSILAALGHDRATGEILIGAYMIWNRLRWWIAMRSAIGNDPDKQERARKALRAIEPPRRRPWQRSAEPTAELDDPGG